MAIMIPDFELEYRQSEIRRYDDMLREGKRLVEVPIESVIKMLSENLSYRARIDYLMEQVLRHDFSIPQRIFMPGAAMEPGNDIKIPK